MKSDRGKEMGKLYYYISSILNILKFEKPLPQKPENWYGPFSQKTAEELKKNMEELQKNKKGKFNIP